MPLEPLSRENAAQADAFLAKKPYENAFLQWFIAGNSERRDRGACLLSRDADGGIDGVCYFGAQHVLSTTGDVTLAAFAHHAHTLPRERMILGPRDRVERWWEYVRSRHVAPRITRERQPIYVLKRRIARRTSEHLAHDVGPAGLDELNEIAAHAAAMIRHEIDVTIPPNSSHFLERTARIIRAGWYLRMRVNGELRFQCHIAARTRHTTQLQGVWTPSALRGRGYATQALAAVCDRLLNDTPTVSLYVNDFNADAIRLYERLGFTPAGEFMTIFF